MLRSEIIIKDVQLKEGKLSKKEMCKRERERGRKRKLQSVLEKNNMLETGPDLQGCGSLGWSRFWCPVSKRKMILLMETTVH